MKKKRYLLDTHALIFWRHRKEVSKAFLTYFDQQARQGRLFVSSVVFWETALLAQKGRIAVDDVKVWKDEILQHAGVHLIDATADEMIASTRLPTHHGDPFDRLLIAQAQARNMTLVTRDRKISQYDVATHWIK